MLFTGQSGQHSLPLQKWFRQGFQASIRIGKGGLKFHTGRLTQVRHPLQILQHHPLIFRLTFAGQTRQTGPSAIDVQIR